MKIVEVFCDVYGATCFLFVGSKKKFDKFCQKEFNMTITGKDTANGSMSHLATPKGQEVFIIWMDEFKPNDPINIGLLAHECTHVTLELMDDRGIPVSLENEEVIAYLTQFFLTKFLEKINSKSV
jgi:hypothetical protein